MTTDHDRSIVMNDLQRKILIVVAIVFGAMLLFPPFIAQGQGGITANRGFAFLFAKLDGWPPPVVNITQLLVQWFGVAVIGAISFFLAKDYGAKIAFHKEAPNAHLEVTSAQRSHQETLTLQQQYEAYIGENRRTRYLDKFLGFDLQPTKWMSGWNWAAFFFTGFWALSRKMYGWFFAFLALLAVSSPLEKTAPGLSLLFLIIPQILFAIYADALYYRKAKRTIASASRIDDPTMRIQHLRKKGGVHSWIIWLCIALPVAGIIAAVAIPAYVTYKEKKDASAVVGQFVPDSNATNQPTGKRVYDDEKHDEFGGILPDKRPAKPSYSSDLIPPKR